MLTFLCSVILFDLDGVLIDSTRSVERQWRLWAAEQGIDGDTLITVGHGVRAIDMIRSVAPHLDAEAELRKLESREAADRDGVAVMPGALDLVHSIPKNHWAVVTSGTRPLAEIRLQLAGIEVPDVLVTAEDVAKGKPHPEPYLKGAERLGAKPEECLVIEDAPAGIQSARAASMKAIALTGTYPASALWQADAVITRLADLTVEVRGAKGIAIQVDQECRLAKNR